MDEIKVMGFRTVNFRGSRDLIRPIVVGDVNDCPLKSNLWAWILLFELSLFPKAPVTSTSATSPFSS